MLPDPSASAPPLDPGTPTPPGPAPTTATAAPDDGIVPFKLSEKEAAKLRERCKISERFKNRMFKPRYDNSVNLYRGDQWLDRNKSDEARCTINYIHPNVDVKVATVAFNYPEIDLTPLNEASEDKAQVASSACKYMWKMAHCQREAKRAYHDKELFGFGIVYTGWLFETEDGAVREDGRDAVSGEDPNAPLDFDAMAERVSQGQPPLDQPTPDDIVEDRFFCKRVSPWDFFVDPEADWVLEDAAYCGYTEMVPLTELRADTRLKNTKQLQGTSSSLAGYLNPEVQSKPEGEHPTDIKRVKIYHYYEKRRKIYVMFCDEHDKPLTAYKFPWEHGRYPFRSVHCRKLQDEWYSITPVEQLEPMQIEINVTRSMLKNHLRRFTRKFQAARGLLDNNAKKALKSAMDGALVEHNGGAGAQVVFPIDHSPIAPEAYKSDEWAIRDMRVVSGLDEYEMNQVGQTRRTAQEVQQIRQAGGARAQEDAQQFEMFCAEIVQDMLDLLMQYSTRAVSIPVYGNDDQIQEWQGFTAQDIKGEFLVNIYVGSTLPHNSLERQQMWAYLLQSLAPYAQMQDPQTGMPLVNVKELLKQLLRSYPEIRDTDRILPPDPPQPPPQQPQMPPPGVAPPMGGAPVGPVPQQQGIPPSALAQVAEMLGQANGQQ